MNREEAKQLLELCRPGHEEDHQHPALAEAFALLKADAELKNWFEEQQAIDARISHSINTLEAPADLKATILAGMRLHQIHTPGENEESSIPFPQEAADKSRQRAWWRSPWTGIAALFAIMMVIFTVPENEQAANQIATAGLPPVIQFLSNEIDSLQSWKFDKRDERPDELRAFLTSAQAPSPQSIPNYLEKMPSIGCITYQFEGAKFSMICFKNGEVYHLITADKATYPDTLPDEPETFETPGKAFRVWVEGDQVKILTIHGTKDEMPEFI